MLVGCGQRDLTCILYAIEMLLRAKVATTSRSPRNAFQLVVICCWSFLFEICGGECERGICKVRSIRFGICDVSILFAAGCATQIEWLLVVLGFRTVAQFMCKFVIVDHMFNVGSLVIEHDKLFSFDAIVV